MKRLSLVVAAALFAALLGLLAACGETPTPTPVPTPTPTPIPPTNTPAATGPTGGSPASASDIALINDAITKTAGVESYHFDIDLTVPGMLPNTAISGDYKSPDKAHVFITSTTGTQELINIGTTSYVKQADGTWVSQDLNAGAGSDTGSMGSLGGLSSMAGGLDPTKATNIFGMLARFATGVTSATVIGPDPGKGTHYQVPIYLGNLMGTGGSTTPGETPLGNADIWIDPADGLIHSMMIKLDLTDLVQAFAGLGPTAVPGAPTATPIPPIVIDMQAQLSKFGQVGEITAPAGARPAPGSTATP
jgi:hypothetical protein